MARKKKVSKKQIDPDEPRFGCSLLDEDLFELKLCSNHGDDQKQILRNAKEKNMNRPVLIELSNPTTGGKTPNYGLTISEAKRLNEELKKMIKYIED